MPQSLIIFDFQVIKYNGPTTNTSELLGSINFDRNSTITGHYAAYSISSNGVIKINYSNIQHHCDSIHTFKYASCSFLSKQVQELIMTSTINDFFTFLEGYFLNINCLLTRWCLDWERQQCGTLFKLAFDEKDVISELLHLPVNEKRKSQDSGNNISKGETYYFFCPPKDSN